MKTIILTLLLAVAIFAQAPTTTTTLSLTAKNWIESAYNCYDSGNYCNSIKVPLSNDGNGDLTFTFPAAPPNPPTATAWNEFSYLQTKFTESLTTEHYISVTMQVTTTSGAQFVYTWDDDGNTCGGDAYARVLIDERGDNYSGIGKYQYYRWWSNPIAYDLTTGGLVTVTTALTPDQWSSVQGQFGNANTHATNGFNKALANVGLLGITFGGGCFFGHGVDVLNGTATFALISFQIY